MTFLLILVVATLATAGHARIRTGGVPWRHAARYGLGIAFVVAGLSHLVNTTPFEQHLPDWVPAATTIIVVSGIAEIVLGCALVAARRRAPLVGLAAVVFLVSVFPANVYVAVAGVDVDGLPGGLYPWLRLPLQGLFIVWAWASTRLLSSVEKPPSYDRATLARAGLAADTTTTLVGDVSAPARAHSRAMTSITVRGLTKRFGDVLAVDHLSFDVAEGTVTGFLGPNGAGKTTTLRMLLGLVSPTSGTTTIAGRSYGELDAPFHHVGAVLEATSFHPGRCARDHLSVLAVAAGLPKRRVSEVLEQVSLGAAADRRVKGFSLGMRQRLGLAAALLGDPRVLILDEPANGLDPEGVHWLRQFLRSYADQGGTVLVSSHLLAEVAQTVDDVVIIAGGRLVRQSSLRELANEAAPGVWVRTPQAGALRDTLMAKGITTEITSPDTVVALDTTTDRVGQVAAGAGIVIYEMTVQHFDLEQYFLALTNPEGALR